MQQSRRLVRIYRYFAVVSTLGRQRRSFRANVLRFAMGPVIPLVVHDEQNLGVFRGDLSCVRSRLNVRH
jgi:hypothetical protein